MKLELTELFTNQIEALITAKVKAINELRDSNMVEPRRTHEIEELRSELKAARLELRSRNNN